MTIALVGHSDMTYTADGGVALAWPDGTAAGDTAIVVTATSGGRKPATKVPAGWQLLRSNSAGEAVYGKLILTPTDIASALPLNAVMCGLIVLSGVKSFGPTSASGGVTIAAATGAMVTFGRKNESTPALTPATGRIFGSDGINPKFSSYKVKKKTHWRTHRYNAWLTIPGKAGHTSISSNSDGLMTVALVADVLASPDAAAMTPTVLTPADDASVAYGQDVDFLWSLPTAYAESLWSLHQIQLKLASASSWGSVTNGHWYSSDSTKTESESASTGSQTTSTLTDNIAAGVYQWRVRCQFANSIWSNWSSTYDFSVIAPPAVGTVTVAAGLAPIVTWTVTSGTQTYAQVVIYDSASEVVYNSGLILTGDHTLTIPQQDWTNGGSYTATVQVMSADGMTSVVKTSSAFVVSWTPPAGPSSLELALGAPPTATVSGLSGAALVRLEWLTSGGDTVTGTWTVAGDAMVLSLPLLPFGVETTVSAYRSNSDGTLWSNAVTATITSVDDAAYLAADDLTSWVQVNIRSASEPVDSEAISVSFPLGAEHPVVVRTDSAGMSGSEEFRVDSLTARDVLWEWMADHPTCWWRRPPERADSGWADVPALHVSRSATRSESRLVQAPVQNRSLPFAWVEVD